MVKCSLCPRECHVDRSSGKTGYCGESKTIRIARTSLHQWEEPCITGEYGSGTIFFSGCGLKCIFCQNHNIADSSVGREVTKEQLAEAMLRLQENHASNINLVTASHYADTLAEVICLAKKSGLSIPIVYNTSSYEKTGSLRKLEGLVDIYLPDCKFYDPKLAEAYAKAPDYFETAKEAIAEMVRQVGGPVFDEDGGTMKRGVIVRHLILPGHTEDSKKILGYLHKTYGNRIYLSIMNQYTPIRKFEKHPELNRRLTKREYEKVVDHALAIGVENAFIQEGETALESFIPSFDGSFLQ